MGDRAAEHGNLVENQNAEPHENSASSVVFPLLCQRLTARQIQIGRGLRMRSYVRRGREFKVNHAGRLYNSSQLRHAKPVRQLIQMIRSPKRKNATSITIMPWVNVR